MLILPKTAKKPLRKNHLAILLRGFGMTDSLKADFLSSVHRRD